MATLGEKLTIGVIASGITAALTGFVRDVYLIVEGGPIRYYADGRIPTASVGIRAWDNGVIRLQGKDEAQQFRAIRDTDATADATVEVIIRTF